jgi:hypothetical protein
MTDPGDQSYETIATSRRYVLGEIPEGDWEGYGIWDRLGGNRLVERSPPPRRASTFPSSASRN